ncbi:MAG: hypothetical protein AB1714_21740 [Acidobacteriota bacterium]
MGDEQEKPDPYANGKEPSTEGAGAKSATTSEGAGTTKEYRDDDHDDSDHDKDKSEFPGDLRDDDHDHLTDHVNEGAPPPVPPSPVVPVTRTTKYHSVNPPGPAESSAQVEFGPVKIFRTREDWKTRAAKHTSALEGRIPDMYLDHKGYVTVGIGHYLPKADSASHIPFQFKASSGRTGEGSASDKADEWKMVLDHGAALKKAGKLKSPRRVPNTKLFMSDTAIDELLRRDMEARYPTLERRYDAFKSWNPKEPSPVKFHKFRDLPDSAKVVLFDMMFGLGEFGLFGGGKKTGFRMLLTAIKAGDWETAAENCHITNTVRETRNKRNRALLLQAAEEAGVAVQPESPKTPPPTPAPAKPAPSPPQVTPKTTTVNTLGGRKREPIVYPRVRLLKQWDKRWNVGKKKAPGLLWKPPWTNLREKKYRPYANWQNSGCCPTSLAMVLRWWAEDNPATQGKLSFPKGPAAGTYGSPPMNPVDINHRLHGSLYVPTREVGGSLKIEGRSVVPYGLDYKAVLNAARQVSLVLEDGTTKGMQVHYQPWNQASASNPKHVELKKEMLRKGLCYGPMLANMTFPGHFVVVQGYRAGKIYICDPGNDLHYKWGSPVESEKEMPTKEALRAGGDDVDAPGRGYNAVPEGAKFTPKLKHGSPKRPLTWLESVIGLVYFYFDEKAIHPEWR